jgi:hypothetical protein
MAKSWLDRHSRAQAHSKSIASALAMHETCGHGGAGIDDVNITKGHVAFLADMDTAPVRWVTSLDI